MSFEISDIALLGTGYLLILFGIAYCAEKGWIPKRISEHPVTYILSLGIFASAWAFYGVVDLAYQYGYGALAYYLGTGAVFLFAPMVIKPLAQLVKRFQITSLTDLLVFRYHSQTAGAIAAVCMLAAVLPLLALQIQAVTETLHILTSGSSSSSEISGYTGMPFRTVMALCYCILLAAFTILFGSSREKHNGLRVAMAFESLIKLAALLTAGFVALYGVFDGFDGLDQWLTQNPENLELLYSPIKAGESHTLLLVFLATAVAMPHVFHMSTIEAPAKNISSTLTWAFPLFLLLMALPIFPLLWAGIELGSPLSPQYFTLGVPMQMGLPILTLFIFVGGLSAATGAIVSISLSLSTMLLNQLVLPAVHLSRKRDLYRQVLWFRRVLIILIFICGYSFYKLLNNSLSLTDLALMTFIEALQFIPGIFAIAYWPSANSRGLIIGLTLGTLIWTAGLLLPALTDIQSLGILPIGVEYWDTITLLSISINIAAFIGFSMLTTTSTEERYSAELCAEDELSQPLRTILNVHTAEDFTDRLSVILGERTADREVKRALEELNLGPKERRPYALRQLRDRIEANLSSLIGTSLASEIMDEHIPYQLPEGGGTSDINLIESRLAQYRNHLSGLAAELDNLRLYHRNTLEELPMAAVSLGHDMEILMWNQAMAQLTTIDSDSVLGSHLDDLEQPWRDLLNAFSQSPNTHLHKQQVDQAHSTRWISLHKANIVGPAANSTDGQVILLEDITDIQRLEQELVHSERLASIGRLSAGVAHEIGNPVTGIACLAQNLRYDTKNEDAIETADMILSQTDRIGRIVQSLVSFSHTGQQNKDDFILLSVRDCASEAVQLLSLQKDKNPVIFDLRLDQGLTVMGDPQRLIQVFINLLSNARDASPQGGTIIIDGQTSAQWVEIFVEDNGSGIPLEHQEKVLEPFFTSKEPGEGTGLGLSMVHSIIEEHDGQIQLTSPLPNKDNGTRVTIKLPLVPISQSNT
jgi:signal transduction histidine kinase/Na+/proline symporter